MSQTATQLLALSHDLLDRRGGPPGLWPRASATLTRQALEQCLQQLWQRHAPGLEAVSMRAQLACLPQFLTTTDLAARVALAWGELSTACHAQDYNIAADRHAVVRSIGTVRELSAHPAVSSSGA